VKSGRRLRHGKRQCGRHTRLGGVSDSRRSELYHPGAEGDDASRSHGPCDLVARGFGESGATIACGAVSRLDRAWPWDRPHCALCGRRLARATARVRQRRGAKEVKCVLREAAAVVRDSLEHLKITTRQLLGPERRASSTRKSCMVQDVWIFFTSRRSPDQGNQLAAERPSSSRRWNAGRVCVVS